MRRDLLQVSFSKVTTDEDLRRMLRNGSVSDAFVLLLCSSIRQLFPQPETSSSVNTAITVILQILHIGQKQY